MKKKNINIKSNCDGLELAVSIFEPVGKIKGIFQISHGMTEHKERYYDFMEYLTDNGYVCVINDHRGHGKSIKNKDDLGYLYDDNGDYIVEDLHQITNYIKELYPDKKIILFGHSMGSLVVRKYIKKYDLDIDKLIVCGSPSNNPLCGFGIFLTKVLSKIYGSHYRSNLIQNIAFGSYNKFNSTSKNAWLCSVDDVVYNYDEDELCGYIFTLNGFRNLFSLIRDVYSSDYKVNNKDLDIYFIAGSDDPVIVSIDKWISSQNFLKNIGYSNISSDIYSSDRHEILNEKDKNIVWKNILEFINR